jgi:hypothetical protein
MIYSAILVTKHVPRCVFCSLSRQGSPKLTGLAFLPPVPVLQDRQGMRKILRVDSLCLDLILVNLDNALKDSPMDSPATAGRPLLSNRKAVVPLASPCSLQGLTVPNSVRCDVTELACCRSDGGVEGRRSFGWRGGAFEAELFASLSWEAKSLAWTVGRRIFLTSVRPRPGLSAISGSFPLHMMPYPMEIGKKLEWHRGRGSPRNVFPKWNNSSVLGWPVLTPCLVSAKLQFRCSTKPPRNCFQQLNSRLSV